LGKKRYLRGLTEAVFLEESEVGVREDVGEVAAEEEEEGEEGGN